jgi:flagellin
VSFSINTNITSLQAQQNLAASAAFQAKTINEVTSGLRIVSSGDDAAGLAVANSLRSDQATLTQGIQNANNGLSTLQTIDGGINNISTLLDRASTLAAQSASGTFTGDRSVLNSEFQSVLGEINRQAQAIGLDTGGTFAKSLSVFIGGGTAGQGATAVENGTIGIDLSKSAVDGQALGLSGTKATGVAGSDISNSGSSTVANILANAANGAGATTSFVLSGAGFSGTAAGTGQQTLNVNLAGVTDTATLVTAINSAISQLATADTAIGTTAGSAGTAFANAGITASINTDASGKQQLNFSSASAAFQVQAGDKVSNALLGNLNTGTSTSTALTSTVQTTGATAAAATTFGAATTLRIQVTGTASPINVSFASGSTLGAAVTSLESGAGAAALTAAGITVTGAALGKLTFTSATGGSVNVATSGDTTNALGLGTFTSGVAGFDSLTQTAAAAPPFALSAQGQRFQVSVSGGTAINLDTGPIAAAVDAPTAGAAIASALNTAIQANATLKAAGLSVSANAGTGVLTFTATNADFRLNATSVGSDGTTAAPDLGFGNGGVATSAASAASVLATSTSRVDSAGASATNVFSFNATGNQTITFSANDASGTLHSTAVALINNPGGTNNAETIDQTIATLNHNLQASGDATLQTIVAVKDTTAGGADGIKFISSLSTFNVGLGTSGTAASPQGIGSSVEQATPQVSSLGSRSDVGTAAGAGLAVTALTNAIAKLGSAQANVGKGENVLNYAVALAQTQVTNEAAAESRIRDADLAAQAANLSKAQILVQAGTAALAQANSAPQAILSLLK